MSSSAARSQQLPEGEDSSATSDGEALDSSDDNTSISDNDRRRKRKRKGREKPCKKRRSHHLSLAQKKAIIDHYEELQRKGGRSNKQLSTRSLQASLPSLPEFKGGVKIPSHVSISKIIHNKENIKDAVTKMGKQTSRY